MTFALANSMTIYARRDTKYGMKKEKRLEFFKLQASGNDFILIKATGRKPQAAGLNYKKFAKRYCKRKFGVGADGLLVIEPSKRALFKMRIFNPDGSEAEMCGNGARCTALWAARNLERKAKSIKFDTKAGIIEAKVSPHKAKGKDSCYADVKIRIGRVSDLRLNLPVNIFGRKVKVNYINTGVPHSIILVEGLDKINVEEIGRKIRFHKAFGPDGTNVDFAEILKDKFIAIRTYERGVESETFACGTGAVASAIVVSYKLQAAGRKFKIKVMTRGGEILKVYFTKNDGRITDVWLQGRAYSVYEGVLNPKFALENTIFY